MAIDGTTMDFAAIEGNMGTSAPETAATGLGTLDGDAFLKLMVAQLKYQNPFEPMDTSQMLQQTAALTTVETLQELASSQRVLMGVTQANMATSLMGKEVEAINSEGEKVSGEVTGIGFTADGPLIKVGDDEIPIGNVTSVKDSQARDTAPEEGGGG